MPRASPISATRVSSARPHHSFLSAIMLAWVLAGAAPSAATEYFASPAGSDANPGTFAAPFRTLAKGTSVLGPGDILTLRGGLYAQSGSVVMGVSGTAGAPITVRAYPGEAPVIRDTTADSSILTGGSYLVFEGLVFDGNFQAMEGVKVHLVDGHRSDHFRASRCVFRNHRGSGILLVPGDFAILEDSTFTGNGLSRFDHGIYLSTGDGVVIRRNVVEGNAGFGIHLYSDDTNLTTSLSGLYGGAGILVQGNRSSGNGFREQNGSGIVVGGDFRDTVVENNLVHGNRDEGIVLDYSTFPAVRTIVRNNTFYGNGDASTAAQIRAGYAQDTIIANNIADPGTTEGFAAETGAGAPGTVFDRNLYSVADRFRVNGDDQGLVFWKATTGEANALVASPLFVNAGAADFRLTAGSPAVDAGDATPGRFAGSDFDGEARPQGAGIDIGADEFASTPNRAPVALAGPDQTVSPEAQVSLDGSASYDPDGAPLAYLWEQTDGPAASLDDPASATPRFTAPSIDRVILVFRLTVSDGSAASEPDEVQVVVDSGGGGGHCGAIRPSRGRGGGHGSGLICMAAVWGVLAFVRRVATRRRPPRLGATRLR